MKNSNKLITCNVCGATIAANAKTCPSCGAKNKKSVPKGVWIAVVCLFIFAGIAGSIDGSDSSSTTNSNTTVQTSTTSIPSKESAFDGDCGIAASAEMGTNIIGYPKLTISIENTSKKDIAAIKFLAVPYDVYGEEITGWMATQRYLYTDTTIPAGKSDQLVYDPFIEDSIKTMKLYVYSVYFSDGTEWGNKDATESTILKYGTSIRVDGES